MTFFKSAATATAIATLLAAPLAAQTMTGESDTSGGAKATAGVGAGVGAATDSMAANTGAAVGIDATGGGDTSMVANGASAENAQDAMTETMASVDSATTEAINAGSAVAVSSDATTIGKVESVEPQADGNMRYTIVLDQSLGLGTDRVNFTTAQALNSDGELDLGMSDEDFAAAVTQQTGAQSSTQTKTN